MGTTANPLSLSLLPGNYTILFQLAGFQDQTIQVTVAPGAAESVNAALVPATGFIQITSNVAGALVFVNGSLVGVIGADGTLVVEMNVGVKQVVVLAEGFLVAVGSITVQPGATGEVLANLDPVP